LLHTTNGFELCQYFKQQPSLRDTPIVLTSAIYLSEQERAHGLRFGSTHYEILADYCLMKPFDPEELCVQLAYLLHKTEPPPYIPHILIVDDEIQIRELLVSTLQGQNYRLTQAAAGKPALEFLHGAAQDANVPDLVLLDYKLPDISGLEVLRDIRARWPQLAVIMMTAYGDESIAIHAIEEHVDGYLRKPFVVDTLFSVVTHTLQRHRIERERQRLIAQLRESNREVIAHYERLEQANRELRTLAQLKSEFLANIGHELRTPLNSIIGFTELLIKGYSGDLTQDQRRQLGMVLQSGNQLLRVLNDVIELAMLNAGQIELHREYLAIPHIIDEVAQALHAQIQHKGLSLVVRGEPSLPLCYCSREKVRLILMNLVENAVKFSSSGAITITTQLLSSAPEFLPSRQSGNGRHAAPRQAPQSLPAFDPLAFPAILVSISDQGIGIAEEHFAILFDEFRQIDGSLTREYNGTGLGLSITKKLIDMHRGQIWVNSRVGNGSTFYFILPVNAQNMNP
jgi:signal transduction histidine kinase